MADQESLEHPQRLQIDLYPSHVHQQLPMRVHVHHSQNSVSRSTSIKVHPRSCKRAPAAHMFGATPTFVKNISQAMPDRLLRPCNVTSVVSVTQSSCSYNVHKMMAISTMQ